MPSRRLIRVIVSDDSISSPPTRRENWSDTGFRVLTRLCTVFIVLLLFWILWEIGRKAVPVMGEHGLKFLTSSSWDANRSQFGVLPQIWGTLYSSFLALLMGGFFGVVIAIFLTQDFLPPSLQIIFKNGPMHLTQVTTSCCGCTGKIHLLNHNM